MKTIRRRKRLCLDSIYHFIRRCRLETQRCEAARAYVAAIVLLGAALEYLLTAWIRAYPSVIRAEGKKFTDRWGLWELSQIAYRAGFLDYRAFQASERIRKFRNLVHPNWYAGRKPLKLSKNILDARFADFDRVIDSIERNL
jgi:hypothetical protein